MTRMRLMCFLVSEEHLLMSKSASVAPSSSAACTTCAQLRSESAARLVEGSVSALSPSGPQLVDMRYDS